MFDALHPLLFARYVEQLETLKSQEKTITRNAQVVEQMYALLAQYDVKAPSEDMVQVDDLRTIKVDGMQTRSESAVLCSQTTPIDALDSI